LTRFVQQRGVKARRICIVRRSCSKPSVSFDNGEVIKEWQHSLHELELITKGNGVGVGGTIKFSEPDGKAEVNELGDPVAHTGRIEVGGIAVIDVDANKVEIASCAVAEEPGEPSFWWYGGAACCNGG